MSDVFSDSHVTLAILIIIVILLVVVRKKSRKPKRQSYSDVKRISSRENFISNTFLVYTFIPVL